MKKLIGITLLFATIQAHASCEDELAHFEAASSKSGMVYMAVFIKNRFDEFPTHFVTRKIKLTKADVDAKQDESDLRKAELQACINKTKGN